MGKVVTEALSETVGKVVARCDHAPKVLKGLQRRRRQCAGEASMEVPAVDPEDAERGTQQGWGLQV